MIVKYQIINPGVLPFAISVLYNKYLPLHAEWIWSKYYNTFINRSYSVTIYLRSHCLRTVNGPRHERGA